MLAGTLISVVLLAGCGGDDGGTADTAATTTASAASTTVAPSRTTMAPTTTAATSSTGEFCTKGGPGVAEFSGMSGSNMPATPADMRKQFERLGPIFADLQKTAPAELKTDFEVIGKAFTGLSAVMAKYGYDITKMIVDPEAMKAVQALTDPAFTKATENIQAWLAKNCPAVK